MIAPTDGTSFTPDEAAIRVADELERGAGTEPGH
jgi:hypothetical protein